MSSLKKAASKFAKVASPSSWLLDQAGVSDKNAIRQLTNPGALGVKKAGEAYDKGGSKGVWDALRGGDVTDPGGLFHDMSGPIPDPGSPNQTATAPEAMKARDRIRRLAYRAQGRSSTIKVSPSAGAYTGQPKALLGS